MELLLLKLFAEEMSASFWCLSASLFCVIIIASSKNRTRDHNCFLMLARWVAELLPALQKDVRRSRILVRPEHLWSTALLTPAMYGATVYLKAYCRTNSYGGCSAKFFLNSKDIISQCGSTTSGG
ncbi:hypothetical protein RvY_11082 [Ramazzottius varieornatus]|uniref:Uncharacterized protein n=1 Tax=Ramazzottius varieornatus TaxID=947166 RepID=A0A1D1VKE1_RAMVA|nr:hypothetical protein RvY_11082 [Ramazzottius varieornatus]